MTVRGSTNQRCARPGDQSRTLRLWQGLELEASQMQPQVARLNSTCPLVSDAS